jgi:uncharacterized BrkB/YihY/UPF0761 family membrane protein
MGFVILINPNVIYYLLRDNSDSIGLHIIAVLVRVIIGGLLILYSDQSKFPDLLETLGIITLVAGIVLGVMGRTRFKRLMAWAITWFMPYGRIGGCFAVVIGGFIAYSVY